MKCAAIVAMIFLVASACHAQAKPAALPAPTQPLTQDLNKYPGLLEEFGRLFDKFQRGFQFPEDRSQSRLLPLLPGSTTAYVAFPNYGIVAHHALEIFRQELRQSSVLRTWWQGELADSGPKVEDALDRFSQLSQYLGEEIVLSGSMEGGDPRFLIVAEVRKPGLKDVIPHVLKGLGAQSELQARVLDPRELATAEDRHSQGFAVLVRPDFVVGALNITALRNFNTRLDQGRHEFASTQFGRRVAQTYQGGVTIVGAADLETILKQAPIGSENQMTFERTGFGDMKYALWEHKSVAGQAVSQAELSFVGPRRGVASWLAAPTPLGSLDFVSPKPMLVSALVLKAPMQIFDDVKELVSNANPLAKLSQWEQALDVSLKDDLLRYLDGEITFELDSGTPPAPVWKGLFRINDPILLQRTFAKLLAAAQLPTEQFQEESVTYYTVRVPAGNTISEIGYAFVDGYLIVASSRATAAEAVRLHRTGESMAKSRRFLASLPPGYPSGASALIYEDPVTMTALKLQQLAPGIATSLAQAGGESQPAVVCAYGEERAIREASTNGAANISAVLVVAAIAIPNLLRARIAANEASAVGTIRAVDTAQITHSVTYPKSGYASDLAALGRNPGGTGIKSPNHAGFIDDLGDETCRTGSWCTKNGFRFIIAAVCKQRLCKEFVVVGTPLSSSTGGKSFCSISDGVIRFKAGPPLTSPLSVSECRAWAPLQ